MKKVRKEVQQYLATSNVWKGKLSTVDEIKAMRKHSRGYWCQSWLLWIRIFSSIGSDFFLVEPSIILAEIGNAVGRNVNIKSGIIGAQYGIYSTDSLYFQTALDSFSILVSLDDEDFIKKLKDKNLPIEIYHPKDFLY